MKIQICWKYNIIIEISRIKGMYVSSLNEENFEVARRDGMPIIEFVNINLISKKIPKFIESRIPQKDIRDKTLKIVSNDEGENILNYIRQTNCKMATDKFSINLT
ncbi:MAG: hypothetical protein RR144_05460 [Clostridia bacterium]